MILNACCLPNEEGLLMKIRKVWKWSRWLKWMTTCLLALVYEITVWTKSRLCLRGLEMNKVQNKDAMEYSVNRLREVGLQRNRAFRGSCGIDLRDWTAVRKWAGREGETSKQPRGSKNGWMVDWMMWIRWEVSGDSGNKQLGQLEGLNYQEYPEVLSQCEATVLTTFLFAGETSPLIWPVCPSSSSGTTPGSSGNSCFTAISWAVSCCKGQGQENKSPSAVEAETVTIQEGQG